ncbi:M20/M25/M40 family metallo-hydrolase [Salsuginibacillus kocurii]|uniref:M20/M25/M40 family metallo-hydrolase n=1 Tax=Salsuginibacillus kocurii TaxID=427078 RepID=UPI0003663474|nr:M20/M25/M40 family metallo-hydrolase [Salsuginibacillus kocurii]
MHPVDISPHPDRLEQLTRALMKIKSVNGTEGEGDVIEYVKQLFENESYFKEYPDHVWVQTARHDQDPKQRKNLFAFFQKDVESTRTLIYHAHVDTVGISDFGPLQHEALEPDALESYFKASPQDQDSQLDAESGEWLFGRGALDMKSGIAVHITNFLYFVTNPEELEGNLLLMLNFDEEGENFGVITALEELERLQNDFGLTYTAAINNDFFTPLYDGDPLKYIYTGAAGKVLPAVYVYGREAHVGETLTSIDPNYIASAINKRIHNNLNLMESIPGEATLPPTCLYQRDSKQSYNVQTATSSYMYFNYFIYEHTAKDVMKNVLKECKAACLEVEENLAHTYQQYIEHTGLPAKPYRWTVEVTTLSSYMEQLRQRGIDVDQALERIVAESYGEEPRDRAFKIVETLQALDPHKQPRVILFFAPPYLPHNYLRKYESRDEKLLEELEKVLTSVGQETKEQFAMKQFFPYLADGSFLSLHDTDEEMAALLENFPAMEQLYPIPTETIRTLNIPSINIGVYGKDGHKWTERVHKPYTFGILPQLIRAVTVRLLQIKAV